MNPHERGQPVPLLPVPEHDGARLMNIAPTTYAIRVLGHLDDHWSAWLGDPDMTRHEDGTTTITVSIADQAQLHGVLAGLRDIGTVITELRLLRDGIASTGRERSARRVGRARASSANNAEVPRIASSGASGT
jgi:hypothetical protein